MATYAYGDAGSHYLSVNTEGCSWSLVPELPSVGPVLLAWHRQRLMQEAVGRWLRRRVRDP